MAHFAKIHFMFGCLAIWSLLDHTGGFLLVWHFACHWLCQVHNVLHWGQLLSIWDFCPLRFLFPWAKLLSISHFRLRIQIFRHIEVFYSARICDPPMTLEATNILDVLTRFEAVFEIS